MSNVLFAAITNWVGLVDIKSAFSYLYCNCSSVKVNTSQLKYSIYIVKCTIYSYLYTVCLLVPFSNYVVATVHVTKM